MGICLFKTCKCLLSLCTWFSNVTLGCLLVGVVFDNNIKWRRFSLLYVLLWKAFLTFCKFCFYCNIYISYVRVWNVCCSNNEKGCTAMFTHLSDHIIEDMGILKVMFVSQIMNALLWILRMQFVKYNESDKTSIHDAILSKLKNWFEKN